MEIREVAKWVEVSTGIAYLDTWSGFLTSQAHIDLYLFYHAWVNSWKNSWWNISSYQGDKKLSLYSFWISNGTIDPTIVLGHEIGSILFGKKNNTFIVFFEHKAGFDFVDQIQLLKILAQLDIRGSLLTISSVFSPIGNVWYYWKTNIPDN